MPRIQTCMGLDSDNKDYLESRGVRTASEFVNWLIRRYREEESVRTSAGEPPAKSHGDKELVKSVALRAGDEDAENEIKIRAYFLDKPAIIYLAIKERKHTKADICKIIDDLWFSKYEVDTTAAVVRRILKEEMSKFNVKEYEEKQHIRRD
jgi:hypothetical protein